MGIIVVKKKLDKFEIVGYIVAVLGAIILLHEPVGNGIVNNSDPKLFLKGGLKTSRY
jgi:hypothetical protein